MVRKSGMKKFRVMIDGKTFGGANVFKARNKKSALNKAKKSLKFNVAQMRTMR